MTTIFETEAWIGG